MSNRNVGIRTWLFLPAILAIGCTAVPGASTRPEPSADGAPPGAATVAAGPGCFVPEIPGDTPGDHAEVVGRYGSPTYPPILQIGTKVESLADAKLSAMAPIALTRTPDGLPAQAILFTEKLDADETDGKLNPQVTTVFSKTEVGPNETIVDVLRHGGAIFQQTVSYGQDSGLVRETVGEHATIVKVGDIDAALVESSTWPGDFRSHGLYWSDGRLDFSLIIGGSSEEAVKVAQSLYCAG